MAGESASGPVGESREKKSQRLLTNLLAHYLVGSSALTTNIFAEASSTAEVMIICSKSGTSEQNMFADCSRRLWKYPQVLRSRWSGNSSFCASIYIDFLKIVLNRYLSIIISAFIDTLRWKSSNTDALFFYRFESFFNDNIDIVRY